MRNDTIDAILEKINKLPTFFKEPKALVEALDDTQAGKSLTQRAGELLDILKQARDTDDLDFMLAIEIQFILNQVEVAKKRDAPWPDEINSLIICEALAVKGLNVYDKLKSDSEGYQDIAGVHFESGRDHYPNDTFRKFLDGQHSSLRNALKNPHNETEKQILEARDANVKAMKKLYKQLQIDLLPPPNRTLEGAAKALKKYLDTREPIAQESQPDKQISPNKDDDRGR